MSVSSNDVKKVAHLARIAIDDADIEQLTKDFNNILKLADELNQVNTDGLAPLSHPLDMTQRLREDTVSESDIRDEVLPLAPQSEAGLYLVPKVIE
jgi:aspartyl-tRNA(Asn)/glutamyl-tRNA(Gln) amidotransferase subunit C